MFTLTHSFPKSTVFTLILARLSWSNSKISLSVKICTSAIGLDTERNIFITPCVDVCRRFINLKQLPVSERVHREPIYLFLWHAALVITMVCSYLNKHLSHFQQGIIQIFASWWHCLDKGLCTGYMPRVTWCFTIAHRNNHIWLFSWSSLTSTEQRTQTCFYLRCADLSFIKTLTIQIMTYLKCNKR